MSNSEQSSKPGKLTTSKNIDEIPLSMPKPKKYPEKDEGYLQAKNDNSSSVHFIFAEQEHQYLREYIRNADQKAIFSFTICSGMLAFLNSQHASLYWLKAVTKWNMFDLITFLAMICLTIAAIFFLWTVRPRLNGSKKGLVFFNAIAEYTHGDEYVSDVNQLSESDITRAKLKHCYELAKICKTKYDRLVLGLYFAGVGFIFSFCYLILM